MATGDCEPADVLINAMVLEREGRALQEEGCLSIPDVYADVQRAYRVVVETTTLEGGRERVEATELRARAILHELDHLDGVLFLDHVSPLKRRLLLNKWHRLRRGKPGLLKEVSAAAVEE